MTSSMKRIEKSRKEKSRIEESGIGHSKGEWKRIEKNRTK